MFKDIIDEIIRRGIDELEIEICGSWLWVGGNTFAVKDQLYAIGLKYSGSKKKWYYSAYLGKRRPRGSKSMKQIRSEYGSIKVEYEARKGYMINREEETAAA